MQKRGLHITFFYFLYLLSIQLVNAQTVTNNGLALRVDNGLTVSITGGFTNQTNGSLGTIDNAGAITLTGDWQNNSANSVFTTNTGQASFLGTATQLIGGSNSTTFWDLIENNSFPSTALTLNKPISVNHQLTLTQGHIVTTSTNIITMNNASTVAIGSATSYIKGPMAYNVAAVGPTTINFPIGKPTSWRPEVLVVTHTSAASATYTSELFDVPAPSLGYTYAPGVPKVSNIRYWHIDRTGAANFLSATVQLYYSTANGTDDGVTDYTKLTVLKNNIINGTTWSNISGTATANGTGSITSAAFTSFSDFTFGNVAGGTNPLPIELLSFNAKPQNNKVHLIWSTASEINNDFFTIEKTVDGIHFESIKVVKGAGNSTSIINYTSVDNTPYNGISYYRLKQTDFDGNFMYSDIKPVSFETENVNDFFNIFPNPSKEGVFNLQMTSAINQEILVVVYNVLGSLIFSKVIVSAENGNNIYAIDPSQKLSSGIYTISATSNDRVYNKKLIVN